MSITVKMIEEKEFKRAVFRGYDPVDVDEFLDAICDEMQAMQDEIGSLQSKLRAAASAGASASFGGVPAPGQGIPRPAPAPAAAPEPVPAPAPAVAPAPAAAPAAVQKDTGEAAKKLLASAQQVYDQMVADARKEADEIISSARTKAGNAVADLKEEKERIESEISILKAAARDYRSRFLRLVEDQTHVINSESELFKDE
ncbi:MAG: DivIVA domain-containing protein [Clostridia bacterium]|nr:DivIVA domain-containing protein [Clostridia bacterium]